MKNIRILALAIGAMAIVGFGIATGTENPLSQGINSAMGGATESGDGNHTKPHPPPEPNGTCPHPPIPGPDDSYIPPPRNYTIIIEPRYVVLDINCTITFTAKVYDKDDKEITGITITWSVKSPPPIPPRPPRPPSPGPNGTVTKPHIVGIIDATGLFTATHNGIGIVIAETYIAGEHIVGHAIVQVGGNVPLPPPPPIPPDHGHNGTVPPPPPKPGR